MHWWILALVPKNVISRIFGVLVALRWPEPLRKYVLTWFAEHFQLNMSEAEKELLAYQTLQELFTRKLKSGSRPLHIATLVHPADGEITVSGGLAEGVLLQAKGMYYSLDELVVDENWASELKGGRFATYYLCPTDYHRVHSAATGHLGQIIYQNGSLWPVNNWSVSHIDRLFVKNERMIFGLRTEKGLVVLVMVGATNVGKITTAWSKELIGNSGYLSRHLPLSPAPVVNAGDEVGVFELGSTVILLTSPSYGQWQTPHGKVRMGEELLP